MPSPGRETPASQDTEHRHPPIRGKRPRLGVSVTVPAAGRWEDSGCSVKEQWLLSGAPCSRHHAGRTSVPVSSSPRGLVGRGRPGLHSSITCSSVSGPSPRSTCSSPCLTGGARWLWVSSAPSGPLQDTAPPAFLGVQWGPPTRGPGLCRCHRDEDDGWPERPAPSPGRGAAVAAGGTF